MELKLIKGYVENYPDITVSEFARLTQESDKVEALVFVKNKDNLRDDAQALIDEV